MYRPHFAPFPATLFALQQTRNDYSLIGITGQPMTVHLIRIGDRTAQTKARMIDVMVGCFDF